MVCKQCGSQLKESERFCAVCGSPVSGMKKDAENIDALRDDETVLLAEDATVFIRGGADISSAVPDKYSDNTEAVSDSINKASENTANGYNDITINASTYQIIGEIGHGGGGIVYKAIHKRLDKEVVIKQIKNSSGGIADRAEADLLKGLKHAYLPQVLDFIENDGGSYTVMDFVSGSDIEKLVRQGRKFRQKEILKIAVQLCEAVDYLHRCKPPIIHSDIKPANIMLGDNGDICLIDFNVSLFFDKKTKVLGGTPGYSPPEQLGIPLSVIKNGIEGTLPIGQSTEYINERSDVYSIGASLYYIITGEKPAVNYKCAPITDLASGVSDGLVHIVAKAMMLNPAKRYGSAGEMLSALKNIGKLDKRYKALKVRRAAVTVIFAALMIGFVSLNRSGAEKLAKEHEEKYRGYISEIAADIDSGDYSAAEAVIEKAREFEPFRIEPYYNYQKILHASKKYEECMSYPDSVLNADVLSNVLNGKDIEADMYVMAADSAFELENYEQSITLYEKALFYSDKLTDCYRDLSISYARTGDISKAEETLERAKELGISNDRLELMQGEISAAKGDVGAAYRSFEKTLEITEDDYIRFRALLACDKTIVSADPSAENAMSMIELFNSQKGRLSAEYSGIAQEMLANEYARYAELSGDAEYYVKAAECYGELFENGTLGYGLQKNYFNILYSKLQKYDECSDVLNKMEQHNPEDYWIAMSRAYVCISVENSKSDQMRRDYSAAYEAYKKAEDQYEKFVRNGKSDANMDSLRSAVSELIAYGWIKGD